MAGNSSSPLIDVHQLRRLLGEAAHVFTVEAIGACPSTNTLLLDQAEAGAPSGKVVVTDRQTAGRGSRGRQWQASPEASLTFSVLWRFGDDLEKLTGLSLVVGLALVRALESIGANDVGLKWPNDILHGGRKLGGILVELHTEARSAGAVIGIGLNLAMPPAFDTTSAIALAPTALTEILAQCPERTVVLAAVLRELALLLPGFAGDGLAPFLVDWQRRNVWRDQLVSLVRDQQVLAQGICRGIDQDGALLVETDGRVERFLSGDLSIRAIA